MRILLDHNIPESLRNLITDHEVHTATNTTCRPSGCE